MKPRHLLPLALVAPTALAACMFGAPGNVGVSTTPLSAPPSAGPGATPSGTPTPSASPSGQGLPPGVFFRDTFDGPTLDTTRWKAFERNGVVIVRDGALNMLVSGNSATFPMVVPTQDNVPKEGPYYVEIKYELKTAGKLSSFNVDFLPPDADQEPGLTEPFSRWERYQIYLNFQHRTESGLVSAVAPQGSLNPGAPHRYRLEFDGNNTYRVIYDELELTTFQSRRRPTRAWFGPSPNKPGAETSWAHWAVDAVESGVLVTPDPAKPRATPAPATTASPSAAPGADASPVAASPSPEASATTAP